MKKSFIMPFVWWDISAFQNPTVQVQMIMFTKYLHLQSFNLKHNYLVTTLKTLEAVNGKPCQATRLRVRTGSCSPAAVRTARLLRLVSRGSLLPGGQLEWTVLLGLSESSPSLLVTGSRPKPGPRQRGV